MRTERTESIKKEAPACDISAECVTASGLLFSFFDSKEFDYILLDGIRYSAICGKHVDLGIAERGTVRRDTSAEIVQRNTEEIRQSYQGVQGRLPCSVLISRVCRSGAIDSRGNLSLGEISRFAQLFELELDGHLFPPFVSTVFDAETVLAAYFPHR